MNALKNLSIIAVLAYCGSVLAANPPLDYKSVTRSDAELSQKINQQLLADRNLTAKDWEGLTVTVKNGKVALSGTVTTDAALKEVKKVALQNSDRVEDYQLKSQEAQDRENVESTRGG